MSEKKPINLEASVRRRLLNASRERSEDFNLVLTRYATERFLYRLSVSPYANQFVLKGALLIGVWLEKTYRPTRDIDLMSYGDNTPQSIIPIFQEVCEIDVEPDAVTFDSRSVRVERMRGALEFQGLRVHLRAHLEKARIDMRIDIGFGDAVFPREIAIALPTILEFPQPILKAYPTETVVAEKFEAMIALGFTNSRMKDFYDIWRLSSECDFDGELLLAAIEATLEKRKTQISVLPPVALSDDFAGDAEKSKQWHAFLNRIGSAERTDLESMVSGLRDFLIPLAVAAKDHVNFRGRWRAGGPWVDT